MMDPLKFGKDTVYYSDDNQPLAQEAGELLRELRARGLQLTGASVTFPLRLFITNQLPEWQHFTPIKRLIGVWLIGLLELAILLFVNCFRCLGPLGGMIYFLIYFALFLVVAFTVLIAVAVPRTRRALRDNWPHFTVTTLAQSRWPMIIIHWPDAPEYSFKAEIFLPWDRARVWRDYLAVGYGMSLIYSRRRAYILPPWLSIGFGYWFAEQALGKQIIRLETQELIKTVEPATPFYKLAQTDEKASQALVARYYWEVRALIDASRLDELFTTPAKQLSQLRDSIKADCVSEN